jgi:hypothetical protein
VPPSPLCAFCLLSALQVVESREELFRLYQQHLLYEDNYGTIAAFALVIVLFLYYLAFILLLGAEVNSRAAGQQATAADLPGVLHAVQVHHTLREQRDRQPACCTKRCNTTPGPERCAMPRRCCAVLAPDVLSAGDFPVTAVRLGSRLGMRSPTCHDQGHRGAVPRLS